MFYHFNSLPAGPSSPKFLPDKPEDPQTKSFCPPGASFRPGDFMGYPSNPSHSEFDLEAILPAGPLARTRVPEHITVRVPGTPSSRRYLGWALSCPLTDLGLFSCASSLMLSSWGQYCGGGHPLGLVAQPSPTSAIPPKAQYPGTTARANQGLISILWLGAWRGNNCGLWQVWGSWI
ncbi:hypothetical protein DSO57_1038023 [Entomophthora muscae]|uniref:Uncharacterized protein n=1 Tax=Entomophthora muscae TaxID=34485 RepID=A0ACC2SN81_9FUNG|nr:hypothetical protein DSO57_1038023 [Entomophthora muscae]